MQEGRRKIKQASREINSQGVKHERQGHRHRPRGKREGRGVRYARRKKVEKVSRGIGR